MQMFRYVLVASLGLGRLSASEGSQDPSSLSDISEASTDSLNSDFEYVFSPCSFEGSVPTTWGGSTIGPRCISYRASSEICERLVLENHPGVVEVVQRARCHSAPPVLPSPSNSRKVDADLVTQEQ